MTTSHSFSPSVKILNYLQKIFNVLLRSQKAKYFFHPCGAQRGSHSFRCNNYQPNFRGWSSQRFYHQQSFNPATSSLQQGVYVSLFPLAGRVKHYSQNWALISNDPWVIETVQGYHIDLLQVPFQHALPLLAVHSREQSALIDLEVNQMLEKAAIHIVHPHEKEQGFISALFLVPKKGGGQRPAVNLRPLNQYIPYKHFKMEGIHMLRDLLRKGNYMVKIDLKDGKTIRNSFGLFGREQCTSLHAYLSACQLPLRC